MDPISLLVTVGTTLKIVKEVWEGCQFVQRVFETYSGGHKTLQLMALECNIYGESIKTIGQWLKKNQNATGLTRQMRTTHSAITLVQVSMANVLLDLKRYQDNGAKASMKDKKMSNREMNIKMFQQYIVKPAQLQWFAETMRTHLVELRAHAATLHLTLGVIELTGHTPENRERAPKSLEDKTGKLEKRLLLRKIITKALDIKRAEIVELAKLDESKQLPPNASPGLIQRSTQNLTFYDVVQLARQQAFAEKTRRLSEDLIDFSDTPQPKLNQALLTSSQCDLELLDSINPFLSFQNESWTPNLDQIVELSSTQPAIAEMDANPSQKPSVVDSLKPVELETSQADVLGKNISAIAEMDAGPSQKSIVVDSLKPVELQDSQTDVLREKEPTEPLTSAETFNQPIFKLHESSEALTYPGRDRKESLAAVEPVGREGSLAGGSDRREANNPYASLATSNQPSVPINQPNTALIDLEDNTDETFTDISSPNTAAPSIFSHSSSLTSKTGSSLPGITEEDVQARNSSSHISLKKASLIPKYFQPPARVPSISESLSHDNDAELYRHSCIDSTPTTQTDLGFPVKPQRTQSEDSVSISPTLPQLSNLDEPDEQGYPWIVQAARDGNEQLIRKLLASGADTKASHTSTRRHALLEASIQGHQNIVDLLIEEGSPLEYTDSEGYTALHHACRRGHLTIAKSLITSRALIDAVGPQGQTALHLAMQVPYQNVVMLLIQHKANVNARDASFQTPLHIGASQGNTAMCNYLLNEGAQLDSREAQSKTSLQIACEEGHYELVQMMLNRSNLNPTNMTFLTAFFAAVEYGHVRIAETFFPYGLKLQELKKSSYKPATLAAKSGCLAMVELMIQEDCDINARDENGWNALHFASYHGHYQVIEPLIARDVSSITVTSRKETPLLFAVKRGHFAVAERLLRSDKNSNLIGTEDEQGQQAIHHTARAGSVEIFNLLMSYGAKINVETSFGWQPLHIATAYGHLALVERLLQEGANVEVKLTSTSIKKDQTHKIVEEGYWAEARFPYPGSRPLHLACEYGRDQIANYLISKGAKMETTCSEGWQPLHHAAYFGSSALVNMLLEGGVNPHAVTNEGKTAQTLQFCASGAPILEEEKERIRNLLKEAMDRVRKQKSFKVALKKGSTVEEKNKMIRAATFSMAFVSRTQSQMTMSTTQALDPAFTHSNSVASSQRPPMPHLPHTSPLPLADSRSVSSSHHPPTPDLPSCRAASLALPTTIDSNLENISTSTSEAPAEALAATDQPPLLNITDASNPAPAPNTEMEVSVQPKPKIKRRSTFGLSKVKPGIDVGKIGLGNMGKPAFEIGKQTFDIGKQTLELGKQGLDKSKQGLDAIQGLEIKKQGLEMGKQGLDMGKQGLDMGKQGYKKAKKFAKKGKLGKRSQKSKSNDGQDSIDGSKGDSKAGKNATKDGVDKKLESIREKDNDSKNDVDTINNVEDNDDDDDDDDTGSVFSLGEFADLGNDKF